MIALDAVTVVFAPGTPLQTTALDQVDLTLAPGDFVTVIGSNGAGKSSLLNLLAGEVTPVSGRVEIGGVDVTRAGPETRARLVARVFQDPLAGTAGALTLEENLALALRRGQGRGFGRAVDARRRDQFRGALARLGLGLEHRLSDPMAAFSGGQRQAASLLMATMAPARLLLLDEPTAALDPRMAAKVLDLIRQRVAETGLTSLMVTHSMRDALALGNRTIMMDQGRIVLDVDGPARAAMDVGDLLARFRDLRGSAIVDDGLLLG